MRSSYSSLIHRDTFYYHILQPGVCGLVLWSGSDHDPEIQKETEKRSAGNTFRSFNKRAVRYSPSQAVRGSGENGTEHGRRAGGTLKTPEPEHTAGICRQEIRETAGEPERIHGWSGGDGAHPAFRTAAGAKLRNKRARSAAQYAAGFVCHGRNCPQGQRDLRHTGRKCSATTQEGSRACNPTSLFQYLYDILQGTLINGSPLLACFFL